MKSLHQSLWYYMPYRIKRNPQELLEALLNQKIEIAPIHLTVIQMKEE